jgi:hypothetical protein
MDGHVTTVLMLCTIKSLLMVKLMMIKNWEKERKIGEVSPSLQNPLMKVIGLLLYS